MFLGPPAIKGVLSGWLWDSSGYVTLASRLLIQWTTIPKGSGDEAIRTATFAKGFSGKTIFAFAVTSDNGGKRDSYFYGYPTGTMTSSNTMNFSTWGSYKYMVIAIGY